VRLDMSESWTQRVARCWAPLRATWATRKAGPAHRGDPAPPLCRVAADEVEKAQPEVFNLLPAGLDDGASTDFPGTHRGLPQHGGGDASTWPDRAILRSAPSGPSRTAKQTWNAALDEAVSKALSAQFRPGILNRIDDPESAFRPLSRRIVQRIVRLQLA